jgi:hypothetical protein
MMIAVSEDYGVGFGVFNMKRMVFLVVCEEKRNTQNGSSYKLINAGS